jgi:hypothetical protein
MARISEALKRHSYNRQRAADELGITRVTLYNKLLKYGALRPRDNPSAQAWLAEQSSFEADPMEDTR